MVDRRLDPIQQAKDIVRYETQEKGFFGDLFGFEARDGFFSKVAKTLHVASFGVVASGAAFLAAVSLPAAVGMGATILGLAAGVGIGRAVEQKVFSDIHDSSKGDFGKFSHWVGAQVPSIVMSSLAPAIALMAPLPSAGMVAASSLLYVGSAMAIKGTFGDKELKQTSSQARALAQRAMQQGVSVEQVIAPTLQESKVKTREASYQNSVSPEEYQQLQSSMKQAGSAQRSFVEQVDQHKNAAVNHQHAV